MLLRKFRGKGENERVRVTPAGTIYTQTRGYVEYSCDICSAICSCLEYGYRKHTKFSPNSPDGKDRCSSCHRVLINSIRRKNPRRRKQVFEKVAKKKPRMLSSHGYELCVNKRKASFGRRVYEHQAVAESKLGRKLREGEVVHHINLRRGDNRPENIMVFMDNSKHMLCHSSLKEILAHLLDTGFIKIKEDGSSYFISEGGICQVTKAMV